jgi:hypothetical protein
VRIKEPSEWRATLAVDDADSQSANAGKCSVKAWASSSDKVNTEWTNTGARPSSETYLHQKFLNEDAVNSLRKDDDDDPHFIQLLLDLS